MTTRSALLNWMIVSAAIILSLGWIAGAAYLNMEPAGGRGGAIAVAISFYLLFIGGRIGTDVYGILKGVASTPNETIDAVVSRLDTEAASSKTQSRYLVLSSVIGTIAWGFGDIAARHVPDWMLGFIGWIIHSFPHAVSHFFASVMSI